MASRGVGNSMGGLFPSLYLRLKGSTVALLPESSRGIWEKELLYLRLGLDELRLSIKLPVLFVFLSLIIKPLVSRFDL